MRYLRYLVFVVVGLVLIVLALANRAEVTLTLLPEQLAGLSVLAAFQQSVTLPLYVVLFGGIAAGLLLGFVWEWAREQKHRSYGRKEHKQVVRLEREVKRLKGEKHDGKDEVLALLEDT